MNIWFWLWLMGDDTRATARGCATALMVLAFIGLGSWLALRQLAKSDPTLCAPHSGLYIDELQSRLAGCP
jgi:hypothetical protein